MTPAPGLYKGQSYYGQGEQILFAQRGQSREAFPIIKLQNYSNNIVNFRMRKNQEVKRNIIDC